MSLLDDRPQTVITQNGVKAIANAKVTATPRRRGLGKKNPIRIAAEAQNKALTPYISKTRVLRTGKLHTTLRAQATATRAYKDVTAVGGINDDWAVLAISEDSDIWQNIFLLRQRSRDLFRTDVYFQKYTEELWANVFGFNGYSMRLLIEEDEPRVITDQRERYFVEREYKRRNRVYEWAAKRSGRKIGEQLTLNRQVNGDLTVQPGVYDFKAIQLIQDAWQEWQDREYCTVHGRLSYAEVRQIRLLSAARDGDFFIRHVRDPKINKFGYSQQLINAEWCDVYLNTYLRNGNEIRMGIERDKWGRPTNYYFVKRQPMDWQYSIPGAFNFSAPNIHEIIPAKDIIHYARYRDGDSTRPAPWSASVIPKSRHLDKYEEAEVAAARAAACKMGFFTSTLDFTGGESVGENPDPTKANTLETEPGSFEGLPWGVDFKPYDPTHPTGNFGQFRKDMLRAWCAGLPGANYNIVGNDLSDVNYSSGRLGMLDERELWKLIQKFDIDVAEIPTFREWLNMALMTGAIPLPFQKFEKFNKPCIRGRRWAWVDPMKEVQASAMQVANKFISRTRVIEDSDVDADFREILFELAEEEMLMEELGMDSTPVVGKVSPIKPAQDVSETEEEEPEEDGATTPQKSLTKSMKSLSFTQMVELIRSTSPAGVTVNVPPITVPQPIVNIKELKVPEQKAPIVNFSPTVKVPEIKMPEIKAPDVVVNIAPPDVKVYNEVKVPRAKGMKVKRGDDGKMEGIEIETD